jgi:hypothetical protein
LVQLQQLVQVLQSASEQRYASLAGKTAGAPFAVWHDAKSRHVGFKMSPPALAMVENAAHFSLLAHC